jgi:outer membrane protein OmpA-like peptidoglycan-associated protein/uncharacterized coiled-coil protein SlyX
LNFAFAAVSLAACKGKSDARQPEVEPAKAQARQSLEELKSLVADSQKALAGVQARLKALPEDMPDLGSIRSKVLAVEEVLGVDAARVKWLSGKLDAALASGNLEQLKEVGTAMRDSLAANQGKALLELNHQLVRFERRVFTHRLANGHVVKAANGGAEQHLIEFMEEGGNKIDKTTWFVLDRVSFDGSSAKPNLAESKGQLDNLVELLKAYPQAKLKVGVFTDDTGPAAVSKKLSAERAEAVKKELVSSGISAARLRAEGYGPLHPLCPANDTAECKLRNRRIAIQITAK